MIFNSPYGVAVNTPDCGSGKEFSSNSTGTIF